jgi:hypothetical protein
MTDAELSLLAEILAERVAEKLRGVPRAEELLDAAQVAERFGVSRSFVYEHAAELGAIRLGALGEGRRPRLRFDAAAAAERLRHLPASAHDAPTADRPPRSPKRRARPTPGGGAALLEIRGEARQ